MKSHGQLQIVVTDKLRSYGAAMKVIGNASRQETGRWPNNRAESSHLPLRRRERAMFRFRQMQVFRNSHPSILPSTTISTRNATSTHATISNSTVAPHLPSGASFVPGKFTPAAAK